MINYFNESYRDKNLENILLTNPTGIFSNYKVKALNRYTNEIETLELNKIQMIFLKYLGYAKIDYRIYPGWTGELPFYLYKCKNNLFLDYPHGYNSRLDCPI